MPAQINIQMYYFYLVILNAAIYLVELQAAWQPCGVCTRMAHTNAFPCTYTNLLSERNFFNGGVFAVRSLSARSRSRSCSPLAVLLPLLTPCCAVPLYVYLFSFCLQWRRVVSLGSIRAAPFRVSYCEYAVGVGNMWHTAGRSMPVPIRIATVLGQRGMTADKGWGQEKFTSW